VDIERINLMQGIYSLTIGMSMSRVETVDRIAEALLLEVVPYPVYQDGRLPKTKGILFVYSTVRADYA
jgi:hypothetical protein